MHARKEVDTKPCYFYFQLGQEIDQQLLHIILFFDLNEKFKKIAASYEFLNNNLKKPKHQSPDKTNNNKKHFYDYENFKENFSDDQTEEQWREGRSWSSGHYKGRMDARGCEYYDPFLNKSERYTYSQFKKDKYNRTYKHSKKQEQQTHSSKQNSKSNVFPVIVSLGTCSLFLKIMTNA